MKRMIALTLIVVMAFIVTACGDVNIIVDMDSSQTSTSKKDAGGETFKVETSSVQSIITEPVSEISSSHKASSSSREQSSSSSDIPVIAAPATMEELVADLDNWNMELVNRDNPLPSGYTVATSKIKSAYARDNGMLYDSRAVGYLNAMCAAAKKDGVTLLVISAFRTNARQTTLYNNQVAKQRAKYPDKSDEEIKKIAGTISAFPGTSEHELGLAIDFNSVEEEFENTKQFAWLKEHAAEYGFIMRYPKEKQSVTGVIYEPWHYRYVGVGHAKKMNELGMVLEEYIEYLKKYKK